ncbi:MAG: hypothetical protein DMD89_16175 [Candidatus Rokuibacteriota bacterium]|nr:MAG: hypothetical protein DMD89_16175 [Candidatus Rokubacteria bacterium]
MARAVAFVLAMSALLASSPVGAEHEVYYRYVVLGFVKDATGRPVAGRAIEVVRDKTGFSYLAQTDARGLYVAVTRLGDESAGETLTVRVGTLVRKVTATFDAANHAEDRGTRLDLEGATFVERPAWFHSTLTRFLGERGSQ